LKPNCKKKNGNSETIVIMTSHPSY